jgi:copper resistance protein K
MRKMTLPILLLAFAGAAFAAEQQTIELKDGGKIVIETKGTMIHLDAAGNRVKMKDGTVMEAKDGSKLMMKNNAIWKTITEHGTLKPGH